MTNKILNPWIKLAKWNKVASIDEKYIEEIWKNIKLDDFSFEYYPEPFIGNKDAPIYVLLANPWRFAEEDEKEELSYSVEQKKLIENNLSHKTLKKNRSFYYLDVLFNPDESDWNWWYRFFKYLIEIEEIDTNVIWENFFSLEIYGYHSYWFDYKLLRDKQNDVELPSLEYTLFLLKEAMDEGKIILLGRSRQNWFDLCPELESYNNCFFISVNRNMEIRNTTLSPYIYRKILRLLRREERENKK